MSKMNRKNIENEVLNNNDNEHPSPLVVELMEQGYISGKVLEIGCGNGNNSLYISTQGLPVLGIDTLHEPLREAKQKAEFMLARRGSCARFIPCDPQNLSHLAEKFDTILDLNGLSRLQMTEIQKYLEEINKVIEKNGRVILIADPDDTLPSINTFLEQLRLLAAQSYLVANNILVEINGLDFGLILLQKKIDNR